MAFEHDYGITWQYEDTITPYYVIDAAGGPLKDALPFIMIDVTQSAANDADVLAIVAALRRIASRLGEIADARDC